MNQTKCCKMKSSNTYFSSVVCYGNLSKKLLDKSIQIKCQSTIYRYTEDRNEEKIKIFYRRSTLCTHNSLYLMFLNKKNNVFYSLVIWYFIVSTNRKNVNNWFKKKSKFC